MPPKLRADHTLYHLSPKGFWKKFRKLLICLANLAVIFQTVHTRFRPTSQGMLSL